jgi:vitamin B12 transporter
MLQAAKRLLIVSLIIALNFAPGFAEQSREIELERIVVTNRRASAGLSEASENVVVVDADEIKQLPARNLGEVLKYVAGVDITPSQGFGRATAISIQGSDSRQVRVMIDGIPLNTQVSPAVDPSRFPLENIARIEVIKGVSSSVWGSSLGGVVNIITKDTGTTIIPKGELTTSFAEFHTRKESAEISGKVEDLGYYLSSSYMESGGRGPKDDVLEKKGFGKLSYDLKDKGKVVTSFGYSGADVNGGAFPDGSLWQQPYRIRYGKVGWQLACGDTEINLDLKHSQQDIITRIYLSVDDEKPFSAMLFKSQLYQLSLNSNTRLRGEDLLVWGADFDWETIKSSPYLSQAKRLELQAPYVNYTLKLRPWDFNFGLRYDRNSEFGEEVSPSLGAVYHLKNFPALIRAGVSRAFNAPLLLWKYNEDLSEDLSWGTVPNPNIGAERAWVYELGLESELSSKLCFKFALYRAEVKDALATAKNEAGFSYMKNFEKFIRQGAELQLKINPWQELSFFAAAGFNDIENRVTGETVRGGGKSRQSFDLGIEYKNKKGFSVSLRGYYDRWNEEAAVYFNSLDEEITVEPNDRKMLVDVKISQEFKNLTFFLNIYNLNNSKYWHDYYFPAKPRYFEGGFTLKW